MKRMFAFASVVVAAFILSPPASAQFWEAELNNIRNTNSGWVKVRGTLELGEAAEQATIFSHPNSTRLVVRSKEGQFYLVYDDDFYILKNDGVTAETLFRIKPNNDATLFSNNGGDLSYRLGIGTTTPTSKLCVVGTVESTSGGFKFPDGTVQRSASSGNADGHSLDSADGGLVDVVYVDTSGNVGVGTTTPDPSARLDVIGRIRTTELEITGGADLAEPFDVAAEGDVLPGMVVSIDPEHAGKLRIATAAYDRTVAGVISGAGGVNPGLVMAQHESMADGELPVALSGRVWVRAVTANGAIAPGDLLTTSNHSGHAMKVADHQRAQGAILGKAMTALEEGEGLVLALVSLQ